MRRGNSRYENGEGGWLCSTKSVAWTRREHPRFGTVTSRLAAMLNAAILSSKHSSSHHLMLELAKQNTPITGILDTQITSAAVQSLLTVFRGVERSGLAEKLGLRRP